MFFLFAALVRGMQTNLALTVKATETAVATGAVMTTRLGLMGAAALDPLNADHAELGRMLPEKMLAFSQAGTALAQQWLALNRDAGDAMLQLGRAMMSGRPLRPSDLLALATRNADHAADMVTAATRALAPVHRTATGNARRLARKRRRRRSPA
jgi:hypothetical protein